MWKCRCSCGQVRVVGQENLTGGGTRSCGCMGRERVRGENEKVKRLAKPREGPLPPEGRRKTLFGKRKKEAPYSN